MNEPLQGEFEGIGIEFAIIRDTLTVQATVAGGPSERVGLLAGDKILRVDTSNIASVGLTNEDVYGYLRGKKGTKVGLGVLRKGVAELLDFTVVRDKIPINSLDAATVSMRPIRWRTTCFTSSSAVSRLSRGTR